MRILVATDAWPPQVNGVVRSLQSLTVNARKLGVEIEFLTPEGFRSFPLLTYPSVRCAIPTWREIARRIELAAPDALHIATEGPIGHFVRRYCLVRKITFTTSYMTRFPEYVSARLPVPLSWTYSLLRCFHAAAADADKNRAGQIECRRALGAEEVGIDAARPHRQMFEAATTEILDQ